MAAPPPIMGLPTCGARESSHHRSSLLSLSAPAQPFGFEVGESSGDEKYRKLLKHYHEIRALLCASRLHVEMLRGDLVAMCAALVMAQQEAAQAREDKAAMVSEAIHQVAATALADA